jgi:biotin carboxyl carrier protein
LFEGEDQIAEADEADLDFDIIRAAERLVVRGADGLASLRVLPLVSAGRGTDDTAHHPVAPMPGRVVAISVDLGGRRIIKKTLMVLEGMKMEVTISAAIAGRVQKIHKDVGDRVEADEHLVDIDDLLPEGAPAGTEDR